MCVCDRIGRRGGGAQRAAYADVCSRMLTYALKEAVGDLGAALSRPIGRSLMIFFFLPEYGGEEDRS